MGFNGGILHQKTLPGAHGNPSILLLFGWLKEALAIQPRMALN